MTEDIVEFKSNPRIYEKEKSGLKNNTVREVDMTDVRFRKLVCWLEEYEGCIVEKFIRIRQSTVPESFKRRIRDITFYKNLVIITWSTGE